MPAPQPQRNNPDIARYSEAVSSLARRGSNKGVSHGLGEATATTAVNRSSGGGAKENPISSQDNSEKALKNSHGPVNTNDSVKDVSGGSGEQPVKETEGGRLIGGKGELQESTGPDGTPATGGSGGTGPEIFR